MCQEKNLAHFLIKYSFFLKKMLKLCSEIHLVHYYKNKIFICEIYTIETYTVLIKGAEKIMRTKVILLYIILLFSTVLTINLTVYSYLDIPAESAILIEAKTGQVLFERKPDEPLPPASITKIMTLLIAFEALDSGKVNLDDLVTVSENAFKGGTNESMMYLNVGQEVSYEDLLKGISIVSANDGCIAIAEHLYGSESAFVSAMNRKAKELGLTNSQFQNSTGMPADDHYMSARDIATLSRYFINKFPKILEYESKRSFTFKPSGSPEPITQNNRNPLLGNFDGADGLKTGWTTQAGYCLAGTAKRNGIRLISVVLKTDSESERFASSRILLNHGFNNFLTEDIVKKNEIIKSIPIKNSRKKYIDIKTAATGSAILSNKTRDKIEKNITLKENLEAPIPSNTVVGELEILIDNQHISTIDLLTDQEATRVNIFVRLFRYFLSLFEIDN